jgi:hypothetical protein
MTAAVRSIFISTATATLLAGLLSASAARAERPRIYAVTGARIVTAPGKVIESGTLVLRDGLIEAVGAKLAAPPDAEIIVAQRNWTVYPALIDAASSVGLDTEAAAAPPAGAVRGAEAPKRLGAEHELKAVRAGDAVVDRIDIAHSSIARHREMGFAVAHVLPDKGVFRGESAVLTLRAGKAPELVASARLAQVVALETGSFMARQYPSSKFGAVAAVRQAFLDAQRQAVWSERYAAHPAGMAPPEYRSSDAALRLVLRGERPVFFVAIAALDPGRFHNLANEFGLRGVTVARGLGDRIEDLRAAGMPLLLPLELPEKPELKDADDAIETTLRQMQAAVFAPRLPAALDAQGIKVAFVTAGMKNPRRFSENLAAVVKAGLSPDKALAAVTTTPAELLGLSQSMGTLAPGKLANVLIVEGDLFAKKPLLRHLFVEGYHEEIEAEKAIGDPNAVVDPRGKWSISTEVMGRSAESTWTISGSKDHYTGFSESSRSGKRDFTSVEVKGNAMTVISPTTGGELKVTVIVTGDSLAGETTAESERGSVRMKFDGRRLAASESGKP